MTSALAAIRPDSANFPLLLHILGASVLVGAIAASAVATLAADRTPSPETMRRVAFRSLWMVGVPAYVVMRIGGEWLYTKEFDDVDDEPAWLGIGYIVADIGLLVLLIALALAGFAARRKSSGLGRASGYVGVLLLVAFLVAVWAMGAKPD
jgi:hypothetical protein